MREKNHNSYPQASLLFEKLVVKKEEKRQRSRLKLGVNTNEVLHLNDRKKDCSNSIESDSYPHEFAHLRILDNVTINIRSKTQTLISNNLQIQNKRKP